jgi:hypothetical protein
MWHTLERREVSRGSQVERDRLEDFSINWRIILKLI